MKIKISQLWFILICVVILIIQHNIVSKHIKNGKMENVLKFFSKSSKLKRPSNTTQKESAVNYLNKKPDYSSEHSQESMELNMILKTAKSISGKPVLVTLINDGFIELACNWLCNTKHMGIHRQVLIITTNPLSKDKFLSISSEINIAVLSVEPYLQKDQYYSHVGYLRLLVQRTEILFTLLENKIETFLFESDSLWIKNPIPLLQSYANTSDMVFVHNMIHRGSTSVNGGFLYMFPTSPTIKVLHELHRMMMKLADTIKNWPPEKAVSEGENDQVYLNRLVLNKYGGMETTMMPFSEFPDGKWYTASESQRISWHPYVIHNNWIIGREEKMKRAKQWGHWFMKDNSECDDEQVRKIINL